MKRLLQLHRERISSTSEREDGFTLLELIVTVSVMAILAVIAIPTYGFVTDRASLAAAQSSAQMGWKVAVQASYEGESLSGVQARLAELDTDEIRLSLSGSSTDNFCVTARHTTRLNAVAQSGSGCAGAAPGEPNLPAEESEVTKLVLSSPTSKNFQLSIGAPNLTSFKITGGSYDQDFGRITAAEEVPTLTLEAGVRYDVEIDGTFNRISSEPDIASVELSPLVRIDAWDSDLADRDIALDLLFVGSTFEQVATPNFYVTNLDYAFYYFQNPAEVNLDLRGWDVSKTTTLNHVFFAMSPYNSINVEGWDTSNVQSMNGTFLSQSDVNLSSWDTSKVTSMISLFYQASGDFHINDWDVSNVSLLSTTFAGFKGTSLNLSKWDTSKVTNLTNAFASYAGTDPHISDWDVSSVDTLAGAFAGKAVVGQDEAFSWDLSRWDVSSVTTFEGAFSYNRVFSGDLSSWDTRSAVNMRNMFNNTTMTQNLSGWNVDKVTSTTGRSNFSNGNPNIIPPNWK